MKYSKMNWKARSVLAVAEGLPGIEYKALGSTASTTKRVTIVGWFTHLRVTM